MCSVDNTKAILEKAWLWVLLYIAAILYSVPLARSLQKLIYATVGKEFYTYVVFFSVFVCLAAAIYSLIFKYRVKNVSQYFWLLLCAGLYMYFTIQLGEHPEEAVHFVEYGVLTYFFFRALSVKVRDWTIYVTVLLFVLFVGTVDEFIQWMMPGRFWDYRDVRNDALAGAIFLIAVLKGIRPEIISGPVKKFSLKILAGILIANMIFLGLCLANTPDMVKRYTSVFESLSWLRDEEPMTEFRLFRDAPIDENR
ncbi:hypothetical protein BMS3Bbin09_00727 [bacterium BMS3Bbin09]|nr:hypothetical protein BMS3Bbin09_00727 [bacterium BMS3Bbin09]